MRLWACARYGLNLNTLTYAGPFFLNFHLKPNKEFNREILSGIINITSISYLGLDLDDIKATSFLSNRKRIYLSE